MTGPPILFCDEPTSGLDSYFAQQVVQVYIIFKHNILGFKTVGTTEKHDHYCNHSSAIQSSL